MLYFFKLSCRKILACLLLNVGSESSNDQSFVPVIIRCKMLGVTNCRRVQEIHQRGKAFRRTVMGGGREEYQGVRTVRKSSCQTARLDMVCSEP